MVRIRSSDTAKSEKRRTVAGRRGRSSIESPTSPAFALVAKLIGFACCCRWSRRILRSFDPSTSSGRTARVYGSGRTPRTNRTTTCHDTLYYWVPAGGVNCSSGAFVTTGLTQIRDVSNARHKRPITGGWGAFDMIGADGERRRLTLHPHPYPSPLEGEGQRERVRGLWDDL